MLLGPVPRYRGQFSCLGEWSEFRTDPPHRLAQVRLTSMKFLSWIIAVQSVKESATYSGRFEIRLVDRHADQRRPRSSALRLGAHTL